jgi:hypothetical protein
VDEKVGKVPNRKSGENPFFQEKPKPTRARLVGLLDPLGRRRYGEVERFLATLNGTSSGLQFNVKEKWGWVVQYSLGSKNPLCVLHFSPNQFMATVDLDSKCDLDNLEIPPDLKRKLARAKPVKGCRRLSLPLKSDADYQNFQSMIRAKASLLRGLACTSPVPAVIAAGTEGAALSMS